MRISDWSSDVCSSDLHAAAGAVAHVGRAVDDARHRHRRDSRDARHVEDRCRSPASTARFGGHGLSCPPHLASRVAPRQSPVRVQPRSEEHTSELQSLMRISYAVFCLKKKNTSQTKTHTHIQLN